MSLNYLLFGGGYTLSRLAHRLAPGSFVITARNEEKANAFRKIGFQSIVADAARPDTLTEIFDRYPSIETVIDGVPPLVGENQMIIAPLCVLPELQRRRIKRVIYLSTSGVSGVEDGSLVDESVPANPRTLQARQRLASEQAYLQSGMPLTVVRLSAIYGAGRGIGLALKEGRYRIIDEGRRWSNRIHVDDVVQALLLALKVVDSLPGLLYLSDDCPALSADVVEFYCKKFNVPYPGAISLEEAKMSAHHTQLSNQRISNRAIKSLLGLKLKYPSFRDGAGTEFGRQ